jgi:hypothetical protein
MMCNRVVFSHSAIGRAGALALAAIFATSASSAIAQLESAKFVPHSDFIKNTQTAQYSDFSARPESKVKDEAAFEEMRQSILDRYQEVEVTHSFVIGQQHYDCVPVERQPAVRNYNLMNIATPPPGKHEAKLADERSNVPRDGLGLPSSVDEAGNAIGCEAKSVPLLRTTLETLSHFATLQDFYSKPSAAVRAAQDRAKGIVAPEPVGHRYSYTSQTVNNLGGNSNLNIWDPYVNTSTGEVFSLSQEWYVGGSGSSTQTEEVGWVVFPSMFGDELPHIFIYSTPDDYSASDTSSNCWNNSCGDFVVVANGYVLGQKLNVSATNGSQYVFDAEYELYQGNWWLNVGGTWIGYYPGSKYKGGQNTKYTQVIQFGTESYSTGTVWPPEGSGAWPTNGQWAYSAFQAELWYFDTSYNKYWDSLTAEEPNPSCYDIWGPSYSSSASWGTYFYEGGPGGKGC